MLSFDATKALANYNQPSPLGLVEIIQTLVFLDASLVNCLPLNPIHPGVEVVLLDGNRDGVEQMTAVLLRYSSMRRVQIICSATPGTMQIGATQLNQFTLDRYRTQFQTWRQILLPNASILLWGDVAMGTNGMALMGRLSQLTGAIVAVSDYPNRHLQFIG
jgi:hypothetical protein